MSKINLSINPLNGATQDQESIFSSPVVVRRTEQEATASKGKGTRDAKGKKKRSIDK
jgi:hypothetical protein